MSHLDHLPTRHKRERLVTEAENELRLAVAKAVKDLTTGEEISAVARVLGDHIANIAKYQIRHERHGNYSTPGGFESGKKFKCGDEENCSVIIFGWTGDGKPICPRCGSWMGEVD
jgi:hypothetical protein